MRGICYSAARAVLIQGIELVEPRQLVTTRAQSGKVQHDATAGRITQ
jgi:hypothetical protein